MARNEMQPSISRLASPVVATFVMLFLLAAFSQGFGQNTPAATASPTVPRTADGKPDLQGTWDARGVTFRNIEGHSGTWWLKPEQTAIVDPEHEGRWKLPYQPWAAAKKAEIYDAVAEAEREATVRLKPEHLDPQARCYLDGIPRQNIQGVFQLIQTPKTLLFLYSYSHAYRVVPMDGRPHLAADIKLWMGDSRGQWDKDTLVIDVTNSNDQTWFDVVGSFHSDALHVVERWTLVDRDTLHYEATVQDPKIYTKPWSIAVNFDRQRENGYELLEEACFEGNKAPAHMLTPGAAPQR